MGKDNVVLATRRGSGSADVKERLMAKCKDCDGSGEEECPECSGSGVLTCETCDGLGEIDNEEEND